MPLGYERLNVKKNPPNSRIVFIKPLEGNNKVIAQDFLERVAAICSPIMKANHLFVASLEEHEPNWEFVGRNFNAGEVIQLVLRSPRTGQWLPFKYVQLVMMHELAHCKQMNHSGAFWKVRNAYAGELRLLWDKGYTGDGLWGRGQTLYTGQYTEDKMPGAEDMPEHTCGGTYRSRGRKGKRRAEKKEQPKVSYAERKQRRIERKFGKNGQALGANEDKAALLEAGKKHKGKPRVAGSKRGRELRANALLARLEEEKAQTIEEEESDDSEPSTDREFDDELVTSGNDTVNDNGRRYVKVCEDENPEDDTQARNELRELGNLVQGRIDQYLLPQTHEDLKAQGDTAAHGTTPNVIDLEAIDVKPPDNHPDERSSVNAKVSDDIALKREANVANVWELGKPSDIILQKQNLACPICSLDNDPGSITCVACSHVLLPSLAPGSWVCRGSSHCLSMGYLNLRDAERCGVCGATKGEDLL